MNTTSEYIMRSPNRTHERENFFKYMSAGTANSVLANCSLRWSSPILFNDPFDVPREMSFGVSPEDIVQAIARRMAGLIEHPPEDTTNLEPQLCFLIEVIKKGISSELKAEMLDGLKDVAATHRPTGKSMEELRALWRALLPVHRILCLTESPSHAAMWFHYADQYKGVVLEFRCDDALDSAWLAATRVIYPETKPAVYTADGWAELLCMRKELAIKAILHFATCTKAPDWSYENEWRVASYKRPTDTGPFTDYRFHPQELSGICLGPLISATERESIVSASRNYPDVRIWNVSIGMSREFEFNPVT